MPEVTATITARPPRLYNLRILLAILLVSWAAGLLASAVNGFRFEVQ